MAQDFVSAQAGIRAFSRQVITPGNDIHGTETFLGFEYEGDPLEHEAGEYYIDESKVNQSLVPTTSRIVTQRLEGQHADLLLPNYVGLFCGCMADAETSTLSSGESAIWDKNYKFLTSGLAAQNFAPADVRYRNMIEFIANRIKVYQGVALTGIEIQSVRGQAAKCTLDVRGYNKIVNVHTSFDSYAELIGVKPSTQPFLTYGMVSLHEGTYTFSSEAFVSSTDHSARIIEATFGIKNPVIDIFQHGDTLGAVSRLHKAKWEPTLKFKYELSTTNDFFDKYEAQTEFAVQIPIVGPVIPGAANNTTYKITLIFPKCRVKATPKISRDGEKWVREVDCLVLGNVKGADDQSEFLVIHVTDGVQNYMTALP